jgi:anaerobic sulfite reductase subunit B
MLENPVIPQACEILDILQQTEAEWTFRVANDRPIRHGQFMQLSLPRVGEAPISISGFGDGYADFTIRKVGKVTDGLFGLHKGDSIFLRGCYGNGWPVEQFRDKHVVILAGGTGVASAKSLIDMLYDDPDYARDVHLILGFKNSRSILFSGELLQWKNAPGFHAIYALDAEDKVGWHKGLATEFLDDIPFASFGDACECIVVGPPVMMKIAGQELLKNGVPEDNIWMSFERKMSCAIGKCGHCRIDETYVCVDGPVFNYTTGKRLVD